MKKFIAYSIGGSFCLIALDWSTATPAFAYLDPGTGSYILQMFVAAILGALFVMKPFLGKVKSLWRKIFHRGNHDEHTRDE